MHVFTLESLGLQPTLPSSFYSRLPKDFVEDPGIPVFVSSQAKRRLREQLKSKERVLQSVRLRTIKCIRKGDPTRRKSVPAVLFRDDDDNRIELSSCVPDVK